jgi:hypothetical protein
MGLIDLKTDLKSLKYGRDKAGGGSSGQPFVQKPLPTSLSQTGNTGGFDSLVRGGTLTIGKTADDVSRLTQLLLSPKTLQGPLFTAKQNLLSRQGVETQASLGALNEGPYLPTSTLAQVAVSAAGLHFNKQGINPIPGVPGSLTTYSDVVKNDQSLSQNRLVQYYDLKIDQKTRGNTLRTYGGGPGSVGGIGNTTIKLASDRTGRNNPKLINFFGDSGIKNPLFDELNAGDLSLGIEGLDPIVSEYLSPPVTAEGYGAFKRQPVTELNKGIFSSGVTNLLYTSELANNQASPVLKRQYQTTTQDSKLPSNNQGFLSEQKNILQLSKQGTSTLLSFDQIQQETAIQSTAIAIDPDDFRVDTDLAPQAPNVAEFNRGRTYKIGFPGYKNLNRNIDQADAPLTSGFSTDQVNFSPIQEKATPELADSDLIPFYIQFYNYDTKNTVIQFRAFLKNFNDNFNGEWNSFRYMGRGENFYNYQGFNREISLGFTVHAQSKAELLPQYKKLNYLASSLAPDYSSAGFMRGTFVTLTVGDYLTRVPGILTGISMQIPENSPWDIGRKNDGTRTNLKDRLPHMIEVNSFNFKPIHRFLPEKGKPFISATDERRTRVQPGSLTTLGDT